MDVVVPGEPLVEFSADRALPEAEVRAGTAAAAAISLAGRGGTGRVAGRAEIEAMLA